MRDVYVILLEWQLSTTALPVPIVRLEVPNLSDARLADLALTSTSRPVTSARFVLLDDIVLVSMRLPRPAHVPLAIIATMAQLGQILLACIPKTASAHAVTTAK